MARRTRTSYTVPRYDADRLRADMEARGWMAVHLAQAAGVSKATVSNFLRGVRQTPKTAALLATALGYSPRRYFFRIEAA